MLTSKKVQIMRKLFTNTADIINSYRYAVLKHGGQKAYDEEIAKAVNAAIKKKV